MKWDLLLSNIQNEVHRWGPPHAVVIQLGENNLLGEKGVVLSRTIISDLLLLYQRLLNTFLFWSCLLEHRVWKGVMAPEKVDLAWRRACKVVCQFISSQGGCIISFLQEALFHQDRLHLPEWGMELWLHGVHHTLLEWLQV